MRRARSSAAAVTSYYFLLHCRRYESSSGLRDNHQYPQPKREARLQTWVKTYAACHWLPTYRFGQMLMVYGESTGWMMLAFLAKPLDEGNNVSLTLWLTQGS